MTQGGSPAKIGASLPSPFFPWLTQGFPGVGPHEAIYDALDDLVARLKSDANLRDKAQDFVLNQVAARSGKQLLVNTFINYLDGKGELRPNFYDGTKSSFCYSVLRGTQRTCSEGHSGVKVKDRIPPGPDGGALTWTPHYRLFAFFQPESIGLNAAGRTWATKR